MNEIGTLSSRIDSCIKNPHTKVDVYIELLNEAKRRSLPKSLDLLEYLIRKSTKHTSEFYIFHHNPKLIDDLNLNDKAKQLIKTVNLNELPLPDEFIIKGVEEHLNKTMLSEYLGIISLKPKADMIGCFTYSIQNKFSLEWASESGCKNLFVPEIKFNEVLDAEYSEDFLYAVEYSNPLNLAEKFIKAINDNYFPGRSIKNGPYKGSFIVRKEIFYELQAFLKAVMVDILKVEENELFGVKSIFDSSKVANRDKGRAKIDARRHTYGTVFERAVALFLAHSYSDDNKIKLGNKLRFNKTESETLLSTAYSIAIDKYITVVICNFAYIETLKKWLETIKKVNVNNLFVVALDRETMDWCKSENIGTHHAPFKGSVKEFWFFRTIIIRRLVDSGLNVLHTDIDAVWRANPYDYLLKIEADIVASQGTIHPKDVCHSYKSVLCCGFILYRSTPETRLFFLDYLRETTKQDDQFGLNSALKKSRLVWDFAESAVENTYDFNGMQFNTYSEIIYGTTCTNLKVAMLPHALFQRLPDFSTRPYVAHLISDKNSSAKLDIFNEVLNYKDKPDDLSGSLKPKVTSLIWLASYPRSGNTMVRTWLKKNFLYSSYSIYNDKNDIGKDGKLKREAGHVDMDWFFGKKGPIHLTPEEYNGFSGLRNDLSKLNFVKTHGLCHEGHKPDRAIYIYRDGRAALLSHANYQIDFAGVVQPLVQSREKNILKIIEQFIVIGAPMCGYWSDNVISWLESPQHNVLYLKYEDCIHDVKNTLNKVSGFTGKTILDPEPVLFKNVQASNSSFFRSGKKNSWSNYFDNKLTALFFAFQWRGMLHAGYIKSYFDYWNRPENDASPRYSALEIIVFVRSKIESNYNGLHVYLAGSFAEKYKHIHEISIAHLISMSSAEADVEINQWETLDSKLAQFYKNKKWRWST